MSEPIIRNRLGRYRVTTSGNKGFKTSIPKEVANMWGLESSDEETLEVFLYAEKRPDGKIVLVVSKEKFDDDFLS